MKKKIKDLTLEEMFNICSNHDCSKCQLNGKGACEIANQVMMFDNFESEVEVDE